MLQVSLVKAPEQQSAIFSGRNKTKFLAIYLRPYSGSVLTEVLNAKAETPLVWLNFYKTDAFLRFTTNTVPS
jgi:hypothetical protein